MQVFESFSYNLNNIKFKDTKSFFDNLLETLNLKYTGVAFCFDDGMAGDTTCKKVVKSFPQLEEYVKYFEKSELYFNSSPRYCLCSAKKDENGNISKYIKPDYVECFDALLKKIPNPINFGFMRIALDNINWYGETTQNTEQSSISNDENIYSYKFCDYYSNGIRFFKEFDYGNKLNLVEIMIERKITKDGLEQYPDAFKKLLESLGTPKRSNLKCVFTDAQNERWLNSSNEFKQFITENNIGVVELFSDKHALNDENYLIDSITPVKGFSPKSEFSKASKVKGYKCAARYRDCYKYQHVNSNNHIFEVEIINTPFSSVFAASILVEGYNFNNTICKTPCVTIKDADFAGRYAQKVFDLALELEKKCEAKLLELYGETPNWFVENR